jgi:hypothetical protein
MKAPGEDSLNRGRILIFLSWSISIVIC